MISVSPHRRMMTIDGLSAVSVMHAGRLGAAGDWWDPNNEGLCVWSAYQPKGAANLAASYVDLSGNGNDCFPGVAPVWDAVNGWRFDGATSYLQTAFVPSLAGGDQSNSALAQWTNMTDEPYDHIYGVTGKFGLRERNTLTDLYAYNGGDRVIDLPNYAAGNGAVAGNRFYWNGAITGFSIPVGTATATTVRIAWAGGDFTPARRKAYDCQAFALYDCALTAPQVAAVAAAMAAL